MILFSSDNGGINKISDQEPYRAGKGSYYEGGTRVPMIVFWPGKVKAGTRCEVPVIGTDFYPTFLEASQTKKPEDKILDGESLIPLITQSGDFKERALFWHFPIYLQKYGGDDESRDRAFRTRPGSVIRKGNWKLHEYFEDGGIELYNLADDLSEAHDVSAEKPEKVAELLSLLKKWRKETNAPVPTKLNPKYKGDS